MALKVIDEKAVTGRPEDASEPGSVLEAETLPPWILSLLVCPVDRSAVRPQASELVCDRCGRRYPMVSGVPRMIADQPEGEQKF